MSKLHVKLNIQRFAVSSSVSSSVISQSVTDNSSIVRITFTVTRTSGSTYWSDAKTLTFTCDGQTGTTSFSFPSGGGVGKTKSKYYDFTIPHNNDGTKSISYSAKINTGTSAGTLNPSDSATLPTIPRSPVYNSIGASNITETSARITASINTQGLSITNGGWDVSTDGGSTWTYYSGGTTDKTLTGLTPNTTYWYRGYCVTAGGSANSGWSSFTTYDYPKANVVNDLILKQDTTFTIGFYNPFAKNFSYQIISNVDSSVIYTSEEINATSVTLNMNDLLTGFYNTIPNSTEATYYVKTTCSGNIRNSANKRYIIDADTCKPAMSVVTYEDINSTTLALTDNNQSLVLGYSTIQVTVPANNKATAKYDATITGYKIENGTNISDIVPEEEGEDVVLTIPATSGIINVYAVDSRGQSDVYQIVNTTTIDYTNITKNQNPIAQRTDSTGDPNGVGEYVKITLGGTFWNQSFGLVTNSIKSITYQYANSKTPQTLIDGTTTIIETITNNNYNVSQLILGDTAQGFDISNSYIINVTVSDELSLTTFTMNLGSAVPHLAFSEHGVGIMGKYNETAGGLLQVAGVPIDSGGGIEPLDCMPIGYVYISSESTSPASLFGGTWERLNGYYPYFGAGYSTTSYTGKNTQNHTLTANQSGLRSHTHTVSHQGYYGTDNYKGVSGRECVSKATQSGDPVDSNYSVSWEGGWNASEGHAHNIATVELYAWRRTA